MNTETGEYEKREELHRLYKTSKRFEQHFQGHIELGKVNINK